ncbi:DUF3379 family protein [Dokdonella soli]|uniref:DUF3379 family protein n=1 Tax=Dokdonella soli TaxID=529810 RepID=A0ABP3TQR7_9GAMM
MDCLEFRRLLGSDPRVTDRAAREHLDACPFCADAHARAQAFESRLSNALAVPIPDGLADRILLAQLTGTRQRERTNRRRTAWIALAAVACMALAIGVVRYERAPPATLADLVVQHINGEERDALQLTAAVPAAEVERAFADRGVHLVSVPRDVSYVSECPVGAYRTVHMVMPENGAPVSVVYVVDHRIADDRDFRRDAMVGREIPIANGTLVLAAQSADRFDAIEHTWRDAIEGRPQIAAGSR